jgi:hypothetical protein
MVFSLLIRHWDVSSTVRAEPVEALRQAQGERFILDKLRANGSFI